MWISVWHRWIIIVINGTTKGPNQMAPLILDKHVPTLSQRGNERKNETSKARRVKEDRVILLKDILKTTPTAPCMKVAILGDQCHQKQ